MVVGCSGSGKTTLAREIARRLGLPHVLLDYYAWRPGWVRADQDVFVAHQMREVAQPSWVMDGNYVQSLAVRGAYADLIVFLDLPRWRILSRIFRRYLKQLFIDDTPPGYGPPGLSREYLAYIWKYPKDGYPRLLAALQKIAEERPEVEIVTLRSPREVVAWLETVRT